MTLRINFPDDAKRILWSCCQLETVWWEFTVPDFIGMVIKHLQMSSSSQHAIQISDEVVSLTWSGWIGKASAVLEQLWSLNSDTLSIDVSHAISWWVQCSVCSSTAWRNSVWRRRGGSITLAGRNDCKRSINRVRDRMFLPSQAARSYNSSLFVHIM